jgi:integrase
MIDERYGTYRKRLIEDRQQILEYLGEDFLALEELRTAFPDRYQKKMALLIIQTHTEKAPALAATFCQSFGQNQRLFTDNYLK